MHDPGFNEPVELLAVYLNGDPTFVHERSAQCIQAAVDDEVIRHLLESDRPKAMTSRNLVHWWLCQKKRVYGSPHIMVSCSKGKHLRGKQLLEWKRKEPDLLFGLDGDNGYLMAVETAYKNKSDEKLFEEGELWSGNLQRQHFGGVHFVGLKLRFVKFAIDPSLPSIVWYMRPSVASGSKGQMYAFNTEPSYLEALMAHPAGVSSAYELKAGYLPKIPARWVIVRGRRFCSNAVCWARA